MVRPTRNASASHALGQAAGRPRVVLAEQRLGQQAERPDRGLQLVADVGDEVAAHRLEPAPLGDVLDHDQRRPARRRPSPSGTACTTSTRAGRAEQVEARGVAAAPLDGAAEQLARWPPRPAPRRGGRRRSGGRGVAVDDLARARRTMTTPWGMASSASPSAVGPATPRAADPRPRPLQLERAGRRPAARGSPAPVERDDAPRRRPRPRTASGDDADGHDQADRRRRRPPTRSARRRRSIASATGSRLARPGCR